MLHLLYSTDSLFMFCLLAIVLDKCLIPNKIVAFNPLTSYVNNSHFNKIPKSDYI